MFYPDERNYMTTKMRTMTQEEAAEGFTWAYSFNGARLTPAFRARMLEKLSAWYTYEAAEWKGDWLAVKYRTYNESLSAFIEGAQLGAGMAV